MRLFFICFSIFWTFICLPAKAENIHIAVASNFAAPIKALTPVFEQKTGHHLISSVGATGKLYAQIQNGAPYQILLAADNTTPIRLANEGLGDKETLFIYAKGQLALWSINPQTVTQNTDVLQTGDFKHLAIANPKVAPYGQRAQELIKTLKLEEKLKPKLIYGESIAQTFQFVQSGNATLGFVARSQITENGKIKEGSAWVVPDSLSPPIEQMGIVLRPGQNKAEVRAFRDFLLSPEAQKIMLDFGYSF